MSYTDNSYSSFRLPQKTTKGKTPVKQSKHKNGSALSTGTTPYNYSTVPRAFKSPPVQDQAYSTLRQNLRKVNLDSGTYSQHEGYSNSISNRSSYLPNGADELGTFRFRNTSRPFITNGSSTVGPSVSNLRRGFSTYDPLNKVDRFKRRVASDSGKANLSSGTEYGSQLGGNHFNNRQSMLLANSENQLIFEMLGDSEQTLATAVGRLLFPSKDQRKWKVKCSTGAISLVRDTSLNSHFIQVFQLETRKLVFVQEIYQEFNYQTPLPTFLTFEGNDSMVGILYADLREATNFRKALDTLLESRTTKIFSYQEKIISKPKNEDYGQSEKTKEMSKKYESLTDSTKPKRVHRIV